MVTESALTKRQISLFFKIVIILAVGRLAWVLEPFGISVDESTYMTIVEAWHHYGKLYVDAVERKPPFLFFLYRFTQEIFGWWNIHGLHFVYFLIYLALAYLALLVARKDSGNKRIEWDWVAIVYAIISASFTREFISCNSEVPMTAMLALSFFVLLQFVRSSFSSSRWFWLTLLSAALAAGATLFKQVAALPYAFGIIFWCVWLLFHREWKRVIVISLGVIVGVAIVYSGIAIWLKMNGILTPFLYWTLKDNFSYVNDAKLLPDAGRPILSPLLICIGCWPFLAWAIGLRLRQIRMAKKDPTFILMAGAALGALSIVSIGGRLYSHYFVPASWFFVVLAAPQIPRLLRGAKTKWLAVALLVIPFAIFFALTTFRDQTFALIKPGQKSSFDLKTQQRIAEISKYISKNTNPNERISVWGMASQIYVESKRGSATRFIYADYVSGRLAGFHSPVKSPLKGAMQMYIDDLSRKRPSLFVDTNPAKLNDYQFFPLTDYPELYDFLSENYVFIGNINGFGIWTLKLPT